MFAKGSFHNVLQGSFAVIVTIFFSTELNSHQGLFSLFYSFWSVFLNGDCGSFMTIFLKIVVCADLLSDPSDWDFCAFLLTFITLSICWGWIGSFSYCISAWFTGRRIILAQLSLVSLLLERHCGSVNSDTSPDANPNNFSRIHMILHYCSVLHE